MWVNAHETHTGVVAAVMEWRQQSAVSCEMAFQEAQRWLEVISLSSISPCWPQKCRSFHSCSVETEFVLWALR